MVLIVTCEHGGNRVPARYRGLFSKRLLGSHRGYDAGALELARDYATAFHAELIYSTTSRLLVELNRSLGHTQIFSRAVPRSLRDQLVDRYYRPYRARVELLIARAVKSGKRVVHLSCHSFTPRLNGERRKADVGLLFDPHRKPEARLCAAWQRELRKANPQLRVRRNYPYRGSDDGFTTYLRTRFREASYLGIELEVNQRYPKGSPKNWRRLRRLLVASFGETLASS